MKLLSTSLSLLAVAVGAAAFTPAGQPQPSAMWANVTGYSLAVQGSNWTANDGMTFQLSQGGVVYGIEFRAGAGGNFEIGIKNFSCSHGGIGSVRDFGDVSVMLPVMDPCGPGKQTTPNFTVIAGRSVTVKTVMVSGLGNGKIVHMAKGEQLDLWEKGTTSPRIMPTAPKAYFALVGSGPGPSPTCSAAKCPSGFYWRWVGAKVGSTGISLQPWCGSQPCPDQWMAFIRVNITAAKRG